MAERQLPPTMGFEWTDAVVPGGRASGGTSVIFLFSIVLVYLVLAAQYESWSIPMAVVLAVPTALLGAVAALLLRGYDNNVYTQIGIVLLIGSVGEDAILIVEFAKVQREEGKTIFDAAVAAARLRFRAVLMTAFSFILGVIPLLIATGAGAESRKASARRCSAAWWWRRWSAWSPCRCSTHQWTIQRRREGVVGLAGSARMLNLRHVDVEAAAGAEAGDVAVGPGGGEGGEEVDLSGVALEEHLGDAGGAAEVAVDLEGRVGVEEVGRACSWRSRARRWSWAASPSRRRA
jgi:hypothetical protein